jgi:transposase
MKYKKEVKQYILREKEAQGLTFAEAKANFGVSMRSLFRWKQAEKEPKVRKKRASKVSREALLADVSKYPDSYQSERAERFGVSQALINKRLKEEGISFKKKSNSSKSRRSKA